MGDDVTQGGREGGREGERARGLCSKKIKGWSASAVLKEDELQCPVGPVNGRVLVGGEVWVRGSSGEGQ